MEPPESTLSGRSLRVTTSAGRDRNRTIRARLPFCETLIRAEWVAHEFDQRTGRNDLRPKCRAAIARLAILLHEEELGCTFRR
jgi:hypothetical protein